MIKAHLPLPLNNTSNKRLLFEVVQSLPLQEFLVEEQACLKTGDSLQIVAFYHDSQLYAIQLSRLDIIKYLESIQKLGVFPIYFFNHLCASSEEIKDYYIFTKNVDFLSHQKIGLQIGSSPYKNSGLWERLQKRELEQNLQKETSAPKITPTLKI